MATSFLIATNKASLTYPARGSGRPRPMPLLTWFFIGIHFWINSAAIKSTSIATIHNDTDIVSDSQQVIYIERDAPWHIEQQDPLAPYRLLDEAASKGYPLTSKSIKEIIGIKPKGSSFTRLGFSFKKIGKDGAYSSWSVERS